MKGPRSRYRFVIRRRWRCPVCQREAVTSGAVVHQVCTCSAAETVQMRLVADARPRPFPPQIGGMGE